MPTAWDHFFGLRRAAWLRIHLKNGAPNHEVSCRAKTGPDAGSDLSSPEPFGREPRTVGPRTAKQRFVTVPVAGGSDRSRERTLAEEQVRTLSESDYDDCD